MPSGAKSICAVSYGLSRVDPGFPGSGWNPALRCKIIGSSRSNLSRFAGVSESAVADEREPAGEILSPPYGRRISRCDVLEEMLCSTERE